MTVTGAELEKFVAWLNDRQVNLCHENHDECRMQMSGKSVKAACRDYARLLGDQPMPSFAQRFLERSRAVTGRHVAARGKWSPHAAVGRILEEADELKLASTDGHAAEEACDVMLTCLALLHTLGLTDSQIDFMLSSTLSKAERKAPGGKHARA